MKKKILGITLVLIVILAGIFIYFSADRQPFNPENQHEQEETDELINQANDILNGNLTVNIGEETYPFTLDGNIYSIDDANRSALRQVYNFSFLPTLISAHKATGDLDYLEAGMKRIRNFIDQATFDPQHMTWHDETTAGRLNNFVQFFQYTSDDLADEDYYLLQFSMYDHAELLASDEFHSGNNNHGMYQDLAALNYASTLNVGEFIQKPGDRLGHYFKSHFDKDGVHLENSPEYHFHMVDSIKSILNQYSSEVLTSYHDLEKIYKDSIHFSDQVVLPNGQIPNIGDSYDMPIDLQRYYPAELIEDLDTPNRLSFYESGYDIYKKDQAYLLFRAGYIMNFHHHNDDLSFWLYKDGNIFTEVGSYGYTNNPYSRYAKGFRAHNTLIVNGSNQANGTDVFLLDSGEDDVMSGETQRIENTYYKRDIRYNADLSKVIISDQIDSLDGSTQDYQLRFHLDPVISLKQVTDQKYELFRDKEKIGSFESEGEITIGTDVYFPYYYAKAEPAQVIQVNQTATSTTINSTILLD